MRRRLPPPNWLRSFEAAARHLSFTEAAKELNVTQSAVSQQVRLLENFLSATLFQRFPRRLELTDSGRAYIVSVSEAFERLDRVTTELFGSDQNQLLILRMNIAFAQLWFASRLSDFYSRYPGVTLRILTTVWEDESQLNDADLDIRFGRGHWPGLVAERLTEEQIFPVCAPGVCTAGLRHPAQLGELTLINPAGHNEGWAEWLLSVGENTIDPGKGIFVDTSALGYSLAANGLGVTLGLSTLIEQALEDGVLVEPFDHRLSVKSGLYLVYPESRPLSPLALAFREWLRGAIGCGVS